LVFFNINYSSLDHTFYPKFVSRKTGGAALRKASCVTGEHEADFRGARLKADLDVTESTRVKIADILLART